MLGHLRKQKWYDGVHRREERSATKARFRSAIRRMKSFLCKVGSEGPVERAACYSV